MSTWRRTALDYLPEYEQTIQRAPNLMSLWIDLQFRFEDVYRETKKGNDLNDDLVGRFYKYALWCLNTAEKEKAPTDASSAVCCAFFEHVIQVERIRDDLHRWIGPATLDLLSGPFTYHYPAEEFAIYREQFLKRYKAIKPTRKQI